MDIIFISIIAAIIFSSYYVFGWSYYITVFVINICIHLLFSNTTH